MADSLLYDADGDGAANAAAKTKAKKNLRKKNRHEHRTHLVLPFYLGFTSGQVLALDSSFGTFAGNWIIETVRYYVKAEKSYAELDLHRCLKGY